MCAVQGLSSSRSVHLSVLLQNQSCQKLQNQVIKQSWVKDALEKSCVQAVSDEGKWRSPMKWAGLHVQCQWSVLYVKAQGCSQEASHANPNKVFSPSGRPACLCILQSIKQLLRAIAQLILHNWAQRISSAHPGLSSWFKKWHQLCPPHSSSNLISCGALLQNNVRWANSNDTKH